MNNLYEMNEIAAERSQYRLDLKASNKSLEFLGPTMSVDTTYGLFSGETVRGTLTDHAFGQVARMLNAPPLVWLKDHEKCTATLSDYILNYQADHQPEATYTVRFWGEGAIRAVLSDQYQPFDHDILLPMIVDAFEKMGSPTHKVMHAQVDDHMRGYILFPEITLDNDPRGGDKRGLHPAIYLTNEETGRGGIRVLPAVFTGVCSNGMIFGLERVDREMLVRHRWDDVEILTERVAYMIAGAMSASDEVIRAYVKSYTVGIAENALKSIIAEWKAKDVYQLTKEDAQVWEASTLQEAGMRGGQITWGDLINGATIMSHGATSSIDKQNFERLGGDLITDLFGLKFDYAKVEGQRVESYQQTSF